MGGDSHSPWPCGSNENMVGCRDCVPKGTDLSIRSPQHLLAVENELSNRPRRILGDRAPADTSGYDERARSNLPENEAQVLTGEVPSSSPGEDWVWVMAFDSCGAGSAMASPASPVLPVLSGL
jgi:hypothetical protein